MNRKSSDTTLEGLLAFASIILHPFPEVLRLANQLPYDYLDGDGFDFEPYGEFVSPAETRDWIQAWTDNYDLTGEQFLFFGQDGSGGPVGFWTRNEGVGLLDQPIVFLGSEGEARVVAKDFSDYLWLLASGVSGSQAYLGIEDEGHPNSVFEAFAEQHATTERRLPPEIVADANDLHPDFEDYIENLCGR